MIQRYRRLYTGSFYQRFIEGRWVAAQGAVYPFMTRPEAFCPPPFPPFSEYAVSGDYGTVNPCSFGLWGYQKGVWYRLQEYYYDSRKEGGPRTDEEHYQALCCLIGQRVVRCVVVDPSAASFMQVIRQHGEFPVIPARNEVLDGIRHTASFLQQGRIRICNTCRDAMREFSLYRWEDRGDRDTPVKQNDHAMDDIRYFVSTLLGSEEDFCCALAASREAPPRSSLESLSFAEFEKGERL